jgi:hypothetical protein
MLKARIVIPPNIFDRAIGAQTSTSDIIPSSLFAGRLLTAPGFGSRQTACLPAHKWHRQIFAD